MAPDGAKAQGAKKSLGERENEWEGARIIGGAIRRLSAPAGGGAPHPGLDGPRIFFNGVKSGFTIPRIAFSRLACCFRFVTG